MITTDTKNILEYNRLIYEWIMHPSSPIIEPDEHVPISEFFKPNNFYLDDELATLEELYQTINALYNIKEAHETKIHNTIKVINEIEETLGSERFLFFFKK